MLVISSRISGCRVTDSITLPKMYPTPIPGPMVPSPAPTPRAIEAVALGLPWARTRTVLAMSSIESSFLSMTLGGCRLTEVDGGQGREDECLQRRDKYHLEDEEDDRDGQGEDAQGGEAEDDHEA